MRWPGGLSWRGASAAPVSIWRAPVSSSSSAISDSVAGLLAESFELLAAELPAAYERMCSRLAGTVVEIRVDEEWFVATFIDGRACVNADERAERGRADVRIVTSRQAILDVIDARWSLGEAVLADRVEVLGELN